MFGGANFPGVELDKEAHQTGALGVVGAQHLSRGHCWFSRSPESECKGCSNNSTNFIPASEEEM